MERFISFLALAACFSFATARAQTTPPSNAYKNNNNAASGWSQQSNVTVYIDANMFPAGSNADFAIMQGFFNDSMAYSIRGVTYSFQSVTSPPNLGINQTYVTTGFFTDPRMYGTDAYNYRFNDVTGLNDVDNSTISLASSIVSSPDALTYATAHEESHNNYLEDCPLCDGDSTIMTYQNDVFDPPFESPTEIDADTRSGLINSFVVSRPA